MIYDPGGSNHFPSSSPPSSFCALIPVDLSFYGSSPTVYGKHGGIRMRIVDFARAHYTYINAHTYTRAHFPTSGTRIVPCMISLHPCSRYISSLSYMVKPSCRIGPYSRYPVAKLVRISNPFIFGEFTIFVRVISILIL